MDSRDLIARCLAGEEAAWEALWRRCEGRVSAALSASGLSPEAVEEACQDLFARLWEDRGRVLGAFQGRSSLERYLAVIALRRSRKAGAGFPPLPAGLPDRAPGPAKVLEDAELLERVREELEPREAVLIQLIHADGLRIQDAARVLGMAPGHVRVILNRMRERLSRKSGFSL